MIFSFRTQNLNKMSRKETEEACKQFVAKSISTEPADPVNQRLQQIPVEEQSGGILRNGQHQYLAHQSSTLVFGTVHKSRRHDGNNQNDSNNDDEDGGSNNVFQWRRHNGSDTTRFSGILCGCRRCCGWIIY